MVISYLKKHLLSVVIATLCSLGIALSSSFLGLCFGPALKILNGTAAQLSVRELVGENLASFWVSDAATVNAQELITFLPIVIFCVAAAKAFFTFVQMFLWRRIGERIGFGLRTDVVNKYLYADPARRLNADFQEEEEKLSAFMSRDIKMISDYVINFYGNVPRELIQIICFLVILVSLSAKFTFLFVFAMAPSLFVILRLGKSLRKRAQGVLGDSSSITSWLQNRFDGIETIKHYKTEELESAKIHQLLKSMRRRLLKVAKISSLSSPLVQALAMLVLAAVLYLSFRDVRAGVTSGTVFISFLSILFMLSQSFAKLGRFFNKNREASVAIARVKNVTESFAKSRREHLHSAASLQDNVVSSEEVSFCYEADDKRAKVLDTVSYKFESGKLYTICGHSGSGKSSWARLLLGLAPAASGVIRVQQDAQWCYVPQAVQLMPASIAANIAFPATTYDRDKVQAIVNDLKLNEIFPRDSDVFDVEVGDGGAHFSGGQMQRVLLARVFYHKPKLILIDEGTSALDPVMEKHILTQLKGLARSGSLVIMVAHRRAAIECADEVLYMEAGKLAMHGSVGDFKESRYYQENFTNS